MKAYSLIIIFICCVCRYTLADIMPNSKDILHFGYGINFKYEGMLSHSFDRFYVVTKFILPTINDLKVSPIDFASECSYLNVDYAGIDTQPNIFLTLRTFVRQFCHLLISIRNKLIIIIKQFMIFYQKKFL